MKSRNLLHLGEMEVPPQVAMPEQPEPDQPPIEGLCVRLPIRDGFEIICYDMTAPDPVTSQWCTEPGLSIMLLVQACGETSVQATGEAQFSLPFAGGTAYVMLARTAVSGHNRIEADQRFQGVDIRLSPAFLEQAGLSGIITALDGYSPGCRHSGDHLWLGTHPLVHQLRMMVDDLLASGRMHPGTDDLLVEARALQLLHGTASLLRGNNQQPADGSRINAVLAARSAIYDEPARDWTISALSRHCGLNSKTFKLAFREAFGCTPRQFLQRARIEEGRRLLELGQTVTTVSLAVGYNNPSHFSKLFKRQYGVSPKSL